LGAEEKMELLKRIAAVIGVIVAIGTVWSVVTSMNRARVLGCKNPEIFEYIEEKSMSVSSIKIKVAQQTAKTDLRLQGILSCSVMGSDYTGFQMTIRYSVDESSGQFEVTDAFPLF
jgi:putative effector of murein hydrolase